MNHLIDDVFQKAGGRLKLRESLKLSNQSLQDWKRAGYVPARHAVAVESLTGIPRHVLCPGFTWAAEPATNTPRRRSTDKQGA